MSKFSRCPIRQKQVLAQPEERVRLALIRRMIEQLGFPKGLISVEKTVGARRYDVVCYTPEMKPLLLIECKAETLGEEALKQAAGYNDFLQAPFLCLAADKVLCTLWSEQGRIVSVPFLPFYEELYEISKRV